MILLKYSRATMIDLTPSSYFSLLVHIQTDKQTCSTQIASLDAGRVTRPLIWKT